MNKIEPHYVTFEQAKLLADKKFLVHTRYGYTKDGLLERPHYRETNINSDLENSLTYSAPEQHEVIEWLRINHGIWISIKMYINHYGRFFSADLQNNNNNFRSFNGCATPQEAYSKAIDYGLENLI